MLQKEEISLRNAKLIKFISGLNLGIHVIDLPEKMKFISADYSKQLYGYVKNHKIILTGDESGEIVFHEVRVDANPEEHRNKFTEWMVVFDHKPIWIVKHKGGMFITGFNHHDKVNKKNPYPVFAKFNPLVYYEKERAVSVIDRFKDYELYLL